MVVYKITNLVNGKVYVGQTTKALALRWRRHCYRALGREKNECPYLHAAIRKYGKENFFVEPLENCENQVALDRAEIGWIERLGTCDRLVGYNVARGGKRVAELSPEGKERLRQAVRLQWTRPGMRERISAKLRGRKLSKETIEKLRLVNLGKKLPEGRRVKLLAATNLYWSNPAARQRVREQFLGHRKPEETVEKMRRSTYVRGMSRAVVATNHLGERFLFNSRQEAARKLGVFPSNILKVLRGKRRQAGGYRFVYAG